MPFWLKIVLVYGALAFGLFLLLGASLQTAVTLIPLAVPFVRPILRHHPQAYLKVRQAWYWIVNTSTNWDLSLRFRGDFDRERIEELVEDLLTGEGPAEVEAELGNQSPGTWVISYQKKLPLKISVYRPTDPVGDYEGWELHVGLISVPIGYRQSRSVLEDDLIPLLEWLRHETNADIGSYSLRVHFEDGNPFFGLYMEKLNLDLIDTFQFEFKLPGTPDDSHVRVVKDELAVTSTTPQGLRKAARAALAFQAPRQ